jgi:hypothetical protein
LIAWLHRHPRPVLGAVVLLIGFAVFFGVLLPLFAGSKSATAELSGALPAQATAGALLEIDVSYDNTGAALISPVCIGISVLGPLQPMYAIFHDVDREPYRNGEFCGGALGGGEPVSVRLFITPTAAGHARYSLTPQQGGNAIGPAVSSNLEVHAS